MKILVSAGEASGDLYAAELVTALRQHLPNAEFFGCTGPRMRAAGVRTVVDSASLSVVGLVEVLVHIPRIYREFRRLIAAARAERPAVAILTDSPDFHLRVAHRLCGQVPAFQLIAPQAWAWRRGRVRQMRQDLTGLFCIFPFEEPFFRAHGVPAHYIGHPLTRVVHPSLSKHEFFRKHGLTESRPLIAMLPGSRVGEVARHLPALAAAAPRLRARASLILATPPGFRQRAGETFFSEPGGGPSIQVIEGETWDAIAHADVALAASGTVTVEAALLGAPMVTYYRVNPISWTFGRRLVRVPHFTMVNLIAERAIVPELMQDELTGERLAGEALALLDEPERRERMRRDLAEVRAKLASREHPMERAAEIIHEFLQQKKER